jgi:acetoin:2,6-dichlorophenolindophenol oxidoreductase subunit alpha
MIPHDELLLIYRRMLRIRAFETRVAEFCAAGELAGLAQVAIGIEAAAVGACSPLGEGDTVVCAGGTHGFLLARDVPMGALLAELFGRETGTNRGRGGPSHVAALDRQVLGVPEGGIGISLALGAALAAKVRRSDRVALASFAGGTVPTAAFHEGMLVAAGQALPVLFLCENNLYPDGILTEINTEPDDVGERAERYGVPAVSVDGNHVLGVYAAVTEAVRRAREGGGATLIEVRTFRPHTAAALLAVEGTDPVNLAEWADRDPISRIIVYLAAHGDADEPELARIAREVDVELTQAVEFARASPAPEASAALTTVY